MHTDLKYLLDTPGSILFAGVGNVLRRDDGVGVYITNRLKEQGKISRLSVEMGIENYIGKINKLAPEKLIIVDAADFNEPSGSSRLISPGQIKEAVSNTHNISLKMLSRLFAMPVYVLGIQPEDISFGEGLSAGVFKTAVNIIEIISFYN